MREEEGQGVLSDAEPVSVPANDSTRPWAMLLGTKGSLPSKKWHAGGIVRIIIGRQEGGTTITGELPGPSTSPFEDGDRCPPRDVGSPNLLDQKYL